MPTLRTSQDPTTTSAEAARWFARMRDDHRSPAEEGEFDRWLGEDPAHEQAYQRLETIWGQVELTRNESKIQILRARALAESKQGTAKPRHVRRWSWVAGIAASVTLVTVLAGRMLLVDSVYQTSVGDRKTIQLADGSELTLNTDSMVRVSFDLWNRRIDLVRGQAHFKVAHSPVRPFFVDAGQGVIRAVGTEFDVYRREDKVRVTLVEGRIEVRDRVDAPPVEPARSRPEGPTKPAAARNTRAEMTAGQQISMSSDGLSAVEPANVRQATAWLDGRLMFDKERLQDAVAEINRYSSTKLLVLDKELADFRVSGVFRTDRADSFLNAVRTALPVEVLPAADGAQIIAPAQPASPAL